MAHLKTTSRKIASKATRLLKKSRKGRVKSVGLCFKSKTWQKT